MSHEGSRGRSRVTRRQEHTAALIIGAELDAAKASLEKLRASLQAEQAKFAQGKPSEERIYAHECRRTRQYIADLDNLLCTIHHAADHCAARNRRQNRRTKTKRKFQQMNLPGTEQKEGV